jgi:signal transduction histidine kinase
LYFGNKVSYCVAAIAWITYVVKLWLRTSDWYHNDRIVNNLIVFTLGLIFSITMARTVVGEKASRAHAEQLLAELEKSHQQLKTYAAQVAELATTKERNRLARDIHDSLGHYLTVINVQLEKALAFRRRKPAEADLAVSDAKRLASEALQDVRRSVGTLRATDETFTFSAAIDELVERVRSDQLALEVSIQGSEVDFSKQALIALYRAVQEGLTNVQKHAKANAVHLDVQFAEHETTMCLRDNGNGFDLSLLQALQPERDGQYGLQGLQERLELVGGRLHIESVPGQGTQLFVAIPKNLLPVHSTLAFPAH